MRRIGIFILALLAFGSCRRGALRPSNVWEYFGDFPQLPMASSTAFSMGGRGYVCGGWSDGYFSDLWEYDPSADVWTQKAQFPGTAREKAANFVIGDRAFVGTGGQLAGGERLLFCDFWMYAASTNSWSRVADLPGGARHSAVGLSAAGYGFVGFGTDSTGHRRDWWRYDPATSQWQAVAEFPAMERSSSFAFSLGDECYVGGGQNLDYQLSVDFWRYSPASDQWTRLPDFPGQSRERAISFGIGLNGYVVSGLGQGLVAGDTWTYDVKRERWVQMADFAGAGRTTGMAFVLDGIAYVGLGYQFRDLWLYYP